MANKKVVRDTTGMICCVGLLHTKSDDLIKLLVDNGYLLEEMKDRNEKYPVDNHYKIFVKEDING